MFTANTEWLSQRNLNGTPERELPKEVVAYCLVTWARHPEHMPTDVICALVGSAELFRVVSVDC